MNNGRTALHLAAEWDHRDILRYLMENDADVDAQDDRKWRPLHNAAYDGRLEVAQILVRKASIDPRTEKGTTPLHFAADYGHTKVVECLLENKANPNATEKDLWTPLHFAASRGHDEIAKLLMKHGADPNLKDRSDSATPLHLAIEHRHPGFLKVLLSGNCDVNAERRGGATPLHMAAEKGSLEMVTALLPKGARFDARTMTGTTPLGYAELSMKFSGKSREVEAIIEILKLIEKLFSSVIKNETDQIRACVEEKAPVNARDSSGRSPLHHAVNHSNLEAMNILLAKKADVTQVTTGGATVLHMVASKDDDPMAHALLFFAVRDLSPSQLSHFINAKISNGDTALATAARKNNLNIVKLLLNAGAVCDWRNIPTDQATPVWELLDSVKRLFEAVKSDDEEAASEILQNDGYIINARDGAGGCTSLYLAIDKGHRSIATLLLQNGADPTFATDTNDTPLHLASAKGYNNIVLALLNHVSGSSSQFVNTKKSVCGSSALHVTENVVVAKSLLRFGAIYDSKNKDGKTPSSVAKNISGFLSFVDKLFGFARSGNAEVVAEIKKLEPDEFLAVTNARNEQGHTLLQVAMKNRQVNIARELTEMIKQTD